MYKDTLIFKSELVINIIHALVSVIFINDVFIKAMNNTFPLGIGGMSDSHVIFDTTSDRIYETYLSKILNFFNSSESFSSSDSEGKNNSSKSQSSSKNIKNKRVRPKPSSLGSSLHNQLNNSRNSRSQESPQNGASSYSTSTHKHGYSIQYVVNNEVVLISFPSYDEMKLFFDLEIKKLN